MSALTSTLVTSFILAVCATACCQDNAQTNATTNPLYAVSMNLHEQYAICPQGITFQKSYILDVAGYNKSTFWAPQLGHTTNYTYLVVKPDGSKVLYTCHAQTAHPFAVANYGHIALFERAVAADLNPADTWISAGSEGSVVWSDSLFVGGLPIGTPVQIQVTFHMTSWITSNQTVANTPSCSIRMNSSVEAPGSIATVNHAIPCSKPQLNYDNVQVVNTTSGLTLGLSNAIEAIADMYNSGADLNVFDAAIHLKVLTAGATVVSASGVQY